MPLEDILAFLRRRPFVPFRIHLTDGSAHEVRHPEMLMAGARSVAISVPTDPFVPVHASAGSSWYPAEGDSALSVLLPPVKTLGPEHAGISMSPEEFDAIESFAENFSYELVEGVVVVAPIPLPEETDPNEQLGFLLRLYRQQHPQGAALDATLPQQHIATPTGRRLADRVIWAGLGRLPDRGRDVPSVAVEFVSEGRRNRDRDYVEKRREYIAAGVEEDWIIDRFERRMTVHRDSPTGPEEIVIGPTETYRTSLLPGFEVSLAELLAAADRWA